MHDQPRYVGNSMSDGQDRCKGQMKSVKSRPPAWMILGYLIYAASMCLPLREPSETTYGWQLFLLSYSMAYDSLWRQQYHGTEALLYVGSASANTLAVSGGIYLLFPFERISRSFAGFALVFLAPVSVSLFIYDGSTMQRSVQDELCLHGATYVWGGGMVLIGIGLLLDKNRANDQRPSLQ